MDTTALVVLVPLVGAAVLAAVPHRAASAWLNIAVATATFALACRLPWQLGARAFLLVDLPAAHFSIIGGFVGVVGAWFGRADGRRHFVVFQLLLGFSLAALLANDFPAAWICIAASVIVAAVAIGLPLTADAVAAAWRFFLLSGVGVALALFGTVALYLASRSAYSGAFDGGLLNLAFVLIVIGYGTVAVLAPMPAAALAPLLLILRLRTLVAAQAGALSPGPLLLVLGLSMLIVAALLLLREREAGSGLAFAGIGQLGVAIFAFGLGTEAAMFAGILQLTLLTLTRAALLERPPIAAVIAIAGLPPFGLFVSFFLVMMATVTTAPWLALPLGVGFAAFAWALLANLEKFQATAPTPVFLLLAVVVVLGIAMPRSIGGLVRHRCRIVAMNAAEIIAGAPTDD